MLNEILVGPLLSLPVVACVVDLEELDVLGFCVWRREISQVLFWE
jgi:hypothetical protein